MLGGGGSRGLEDRVMDTSLCGHVTNNQRAPHIDVLALTPLESWLSLVGAGEAPVHVHRGSFSQSAGTLRDRD